MGAAGFWDDQERAARVSAEHARASRKLGVFRELERDVDDLEPLAELAEEDPEIAAELEEQVQAVQGRLDALEEERLFSGRYDAGDALVTVNAGAGGTDAQDWAEMVLRMEMRWAEKRGFAVELLEVSPGEEAGIKSATFRVKGENAYGLYGSEKGVHRLVRLSPFDSANRRQTSFAGVEVSPVVEEAAEVEIDDDDLQIDTYRASGAGGQHVNKTDSAVRITHKPTGIVVQCQNERSQSSNKAEAMTMLRSRLLELEERKRREEIARERAKPRTSTSAPRSAPMSCTRTRWSRTTGPITRWVTKTGAGRRPGRIRAGLPAQGGEMNGRGRERGERRRTRRELPTAPYLEAIVSYGFRGSVSFHVPGHKGGPGADPGLRSAMGERALALDICQDIEGIDVGPSPTPYERAEQLAAAAYGAGRTWFLTNGATQGNHALCLALAKPGQHVLVQRTRTPAWSTGWCSAAGWRASWPPSTTWSSAWPMG